MASLKKIKRDVNLSENGVWVNGVLEDLNVKVASSNNKKYLQKIQTLMKPYQRSYKSMGDSFNKIFEDIQNKSLAHAVLLDWQNMQDDEGNPLPYSEEAAYKVLSDPENVDFKKLITDLADEQEVFKKEVAEDIAGK